MQRVTPTLTFPPSEIPDKPSSLQVVNVTGTTVTLVWIEPFNGNGVITKYMVKLTDPITNDTLNEVTSLGANTTVTGLKPNSGYKCQVYAQNEVGWSLASDAVYFRTEEDAPSGPPLSVTAIATGPNSIKITWKVSLHGLWSVVNLSSFPSPIQLSRRNWKGSSGDECACGCFAFSFASLASVCSSPGPGTLFLAQLSYSRRLISLHLLLPRVCVQVQHLPCSSLILVNLCPSVLSTE